MNYQERMDCQINQDPYRCLESPMERSLYESLKTFGVVPIMQYKIGKYFIDLAFPDLKIAIEYDGEHHSSRIEEDKKRADDISRMGWEIHRIRYGGKCFLVRFDNNDYAARSIDEIGEILSFVIRNRRRIVLTKNKEDELEIKRISDIEKLKGL